MMTFWTLQYVFACLSTFIFTLILSPFVAEGYFRPFRFRAMPGNETTKPTPGGNQTTKLTPGRGIANKTHTTALLLSSMSGNERTKPTPVKDCNLGFKCKVNGVYQCIRPSFKCDGTNDCDLGADEDAIACPHLEFKKNMNPWKPGYPKACNITKESKYCHDDGKITKHASLEEALVACTGNGTNPNNVCKMVTDYMCDGEEYWTCSGTIHPSTRGSCIWLKKGAGQEVCPSVGAWTRNIPLALLAAIQCILFIFL